MLACSVEGPSLYMSLINKQGLFFLCPQSFATHPSQRLSYTQAIHVWMSIVNVAIISAQRFLTEIQRKSKGSEKCKAQNWWCVSHALRHNPRVLGIAYVPPNTPTTLCHFSFAAPWGVCIPSDPVSWYVAFHRRGQSYPFLYLQACLFALGIWISFGCIRLSFLRQVYLEALRAVPSPCYLCLCTWCFLFKVLTVIHICIYLSQIYSLYHISCFCPSIYFHFFLADHRSFSNRLNEQKCVCLVGWVYIRKKNTFFSSLFQC